MSLVKIRAALETALANMPGIIPASDIVSSSLGSFITSADHNLVSGLVATISGHSVAALNGTWEVDVTGDTAFALLDTVTGQTVTSDVSGTGGTVLANLIAWENIYFPIKNMAIPYQRVHLLPARPENVTMGRGHYREQGIFQVNLVYPIQLGTGDVFERAELIRSTFPRGASFSNSGIVVNINRTPEVMPAIVDDEVYMLPVRIYYWADIFN